MVTGRIHSIETFGTVDGPGIRYIIFFQGCCLQCKYCHNRDTWPTLGGKEVTVDGLIEDILKYKTFMDASGGGITASGGEATLQAPFITELFKKAHEHGIHTCLDTCGFVDIDKINPLLDYTDLVLLDLKHMEREKSIYLTGQSSNKAMALAKHLSDRKIPVWIRHVLVPTLTDSRSNLEAMAKFVSTLTNVDRFEFLPYHTLGEHKWDEMGIEYQLKGIRQADEEDLKRAKAIFKEFGVEARS